MIPYDELVIALQTWRAHKGLPVAQLSGALTPPPVMTVPVAAARPGSGPQRAAPPAPPRPPTPPPLATMDETIDEDALLVDAALDSHLDAHLNAHIDESHYENEGDNFSIPFDARAAALAAGEDVEESTSIGSPPPRPSDMDTTNPHGEAVASRPTKRSEDW